jgi:hypothetical protein
VSAHSYPLDVFSISGRDKRYFSTPQRPKEL